MSNKPGKALQPLNDAVIQALELCERFDASTEFEDRIKIQDEAKTILLQRIPQDSRYPAFVNKNSHFHASYVKLCEILKRNDSILLEQRFQKLRRGSQSSRRPSVNRLSSGTLPYPTSPTGNAVFPEPAKAAKAVKAPNGTSGTIGGVNGTHETHRSNGNANGHANGHIGGTNGYTNGIANGTTANGVGIGKKAGNYEVSPAIVKSKMAVSRMLLIDVRPHEQFEAAHIKCPLIACLEPLSLHPGMTERDLEDALILESAEYESFMMRDHVDMIVLYDDRSACANDSPALSTVADALVNRRPYILRGGFRAWQSQFAAETVNTAASSLPAPPPSPPPHFSLPKQPPIPRRASSMAPALPPKETLQQYRGYPSPEYTGDDYSSATSVNTSGNQSGNLSGNQSGTSIAYSDPSGSSIAYPSDPSGSSIAYPNESFSGPNRASPAHRARPDYSTALSGYADEPAKSSLRSLRTLPKISLNQRGSSLVRTGSVVQRAASAEPEPIPYTEEVVKPQLLSTTGLRNLGNTCYMNCILQCLLAFPQLIEPFADGSFQNYVNFRSKLGYKGRFALVFANFVRSMTEHQGGYVVPNEVKRFSGELRPDSFAGFDQQDCQEFLTFVLDGLHEDLNLNGDKPKEGELDRRAEEHREAMGIRVASAIEWERYLKGDTSLIVDLFQGQYLSRLQCMTCKHTSTTYNSFSSLSLPIASPKLLGQSTSLKTCFDEFVKPELLEGDNAWFCPHCQKKRRTVKTLRISRLPPILVIHLKRFKRSSMYGVNKLETPVDYPLRGLDLTKYWPQLRQGEFSEKEAQMFEQIPSRGQTPPFIYDLRAVTLHQGSLKGGHYTAVVQKPGHGWLYYDDANVYPVKEQAAVSKHAYVLFYKRRM